MTVQFLDPRAESEQPIESYDLSVDVTAGPVRIGMLANGFPDSVNFLIEVENSLAEILPGASFTRYNKGDASSIASPKMLEEIRGACDVVVAAYGH